MNKILKFAYVALMGMMAVSVSSCSGEDNEYVPAEPMDGLQVYFSSANPSSLVLSSLETSFDIAISRIETTEAATVSLNVTDESGLYDIPSSVSFASGEAKANISVTYDPEEVGFDNYSNITVAIADASNTTPYGTSEYTVKVGIPAPWTSLGMGEFNDYFMFEGTYKVEIQQNDIDPNKFRLVNPYEEGLVAEGYSSVLSPDGPAEYVEFTILQPGQSIFDVPITMNDLVYYDDYNTGYRHSTYSDDVYVCHPAGFRSLRAEDKWTYNRVISYQENGLPAIVQFAPLCYMLNYGGGWNYSGYDDVIKIVFPGVVLLDTSVEVNYIGLFTATDETLSAVADVTLGEDVESAKVALVPASDADAAADGIIDGSIESIEITASGEVKVAIPADAEEGKYAIVVVTYANGEAQKSEYTTFKYTPATAETWTEIGVGDYVYCGKFFSGDDPGLSLFKSDSNPNRYKIEHWGYDVDFKFTYNAETGEVVVDDQETGYVHPDYGMVYVMDYADYDSSAGVTSSYENGVFKFAVLYYDAEGSWGAGYETFTLSTSEANVSARAISYMNKSVKAKTHENRWKHMNPEYYPLNK